VRSLPRPAPGRIRAALLRAVRAESGASLLEIVIAALIVTIVSVGMVEFFARGRANFDQEERKRVATLLAQEALERAVAMPYAAIGNSTQTRVVSGKSYEVVVTSQVDVPEADIKTIRATVTWQARPTVTRTVDLTTMVYDKP
jgi:Tfp pilus assembly protein PilV